MYVMSATGIGEERLVRCVCASGLRTWQSPSARAWNLWVHMLSTLVKGISVGKQEMSMFTWPVTQKPRAVCILHILAANLSLEGLLNFQGERHVVEHCIWLPVRISEEEEEGKLKEASLKTLISDDISNSGRTTVPFFRTPWVNPGQLSKPSSIPFSPLLTNLCTAKGTIQKKFPTRESYTRCPTS